MTDQFVPPVSDNSVGETGDELGSDPTRAPDAWISPRTPIGHTEPFESPDSDAFRRIPPVETPADQPYHYFASGMSESAGPRTSPRGWPGLDQMTWRQFELAMAEAFRLRGYQVTVTPDGADGGVDLVLIGPAERIFVQCKHWNSWKVGVRTVRELYGVMTAQGAAGGIVATSGRFTDEARTFARNVNIQLLGRDDVTQMLGALPSPRSNVPPSGSWTSTPQPSGPGPQPAPRCPRCGEPMMIRTTRRGRTRGTHCWGCPRFPACRGIIPISELAPTASQPWMTVPSYTIAQRQAARSLASPRWGTPKRRGMPTGARILLVLALALGLPLGGSALIVRVLTTPVSRLAAAPPAVHAVAPTADPRILASIPLPAKPDQLAVDPARHRLYVTNLEDKSLTVVDTATNSVLSKMALQRQPGAIAIDARAHTLWVTNYNEGTVSLLDTNGKTRATISVGHGPVAVALDPGLHKAYVMNSLDKAFNVIDTRTHKVTATERFGLTPGAAAVDPVQHRLCIAAAEAMNLQYCYDVTLKIAGVVGPSGDSIAVDAVTHSRYAVSTSTRTLDIVDGTTRKTTTVPVGQTPSGVTVDPNTHLAYVADHDAKAILVVRAS